LFDARCPTPEAQILFDREIVVQHRLMPNVANSVPDRATVGAQVLPEDGGRATLESKQPSAEPKQR